MKKARLLNWLKKLDKRREVRDFLAHYTGGLYNRLGEHHVFLMAGGLTFSLFVCIVPLILIVFAVLGNILERPSISGEIDSFIDRVIPYESYADYIKNLVFSRVDEFKVFKNFAGMVGLVGLFLASSGLFASMRTVLNKIYGAAKNQHVVIRKLRDFLSVLLVLVYFLLSTTILPTLEIIQKSASKVEAFRRFEFNLSGDLAIGVVSFFVIFGAFFILYFLIPQIKLRKRIVLVSALSAAILWEIAKQLFGYYISNVATINRIYGAYSLLVVVAFWVYYTSIAFMAGAEIGQLYRERLETQTLSKK